MTEAPIDPDCRAGKHANCWGEVWDIVTDGLVPCACSCHTPAER